MLLDYVKHCKYKQTCATPVLRNGGGGRNDKRLQSHTPDGREICYAFNNKKGCAGKCGRIHVCQVCLDPAHNKLDPAHAKKKA